MGARTALSAPEPALDVRHDARNLLQVIEGYLELIAGRASDPMLLRYAANAQAAAQQLIVLSESMPGADGEGSLPGP